MKNLIFVFISILSLSILSSCNKEDNLETTDILIEEITNASSKENIDPTELPESTKAFIAEEHFETFVETASYVDGKGYEITLGTEDIEYFDVNGSVLRIRTRPHSCHRPGPCGGGQRIEPSELPVEITDYVTANYPDEEILRAKLKGAYYLVGISGGTILVFNNDATYVIEAPLFRFCRGDRIDIDTLSDSIIDYISTNCPDGEIKIAYRVRGKIFVGVLTPDGRKVFVFTLDGVFLFERP